MKSLILTIFILHFITCYTLAQDTKETDEHYKQLEEKYKRLKDSLSLLYPFIPAVSSVMIKHEQIEFNFFNSLISANRTRDDDGDLNSINARQTYFYNTIQLTYGLSERAKFNIGLDINSILGRIDEDRNSSIFKVFNSGVEGNSQHAKAITSIAPRIRWRPLKRNYNFTIQSSISFPTGISTQKQNILGLSQVYFLTQFLYNQALGKRLFLFSQLGIAYGFKKDNAAAIFYSPVSLYLSYLIPRKTILFALLNYVPIFTKVHSWDYNRYTFQIGGGLQYQFSRYILINGYYANDIKGKNYPDFDSYSVSVRFLIN